MGLLWRVIWLLSTSSGSLSISMRVTHVKRNHLQGDGAEEVAGRVGYVGEMLLSLSNLLPGVSEQKNAEGHALDSNPKVWKGKEPAISDRSFVRVWLCDGTATPRSRVSAPSSGNMSQPHKKKPKEARKGGTKTDLAKSKPGVSMSTRSSEEKTKASEPVKVEGSKPMSSTSKSAEKPGSAAAHKSADSCKSKRTAGSSAVSSGAAGVKQQQPQTTATHQSKMGQKVTKTSKLDTKESLAGTLPTKVAGTSLHKNNDSKIQKTKQSCRTDAENVNNLPFKEDLLQKHLEDVMKIIRDMKSQIVSEVTHMIEEQISILKATIVKSLENASIEQKKTVIAPLKNVSEIEDGKPMLSAFEQLMEPFPSQGRDAPVPKCTGPAAKDKDPLDLLAETLPSEAPDNSAPKYTGPEVKELDVTKKKGERVGEREDTIPPDYRFKDQPDPKDKGKPTSFSAGPGAKPKTTEKSMTEGDILDSLSADFVQSSAAPVSKCSATSSHSAAPPSTLKQAPLQASTAATVSTSQTGDKDKDPFDLLAGTLPSEAPDDSAPKYTGPEVKESDATKKKAERVGEREDTLPPDYRFKEQPTPKDKLASSSTGTGAKPKTMTESDVLDSLSADFVQSPPAPVSKCSAATSHATAPLSMQKEAPLQASTAAPVSAGRTCATGKDAFDLLADTLPSEAPDNSAPKYTGPAVKEPDVTKKKGERVGERDDTIPPDYRFKEQPDPKDKGNLAPSFTGPGAKPKVMTESDVLESLSADFVQSSAAPISKCSATTSQSAASPSMQEAPLKASTAASVSASQTSDKDKDAFDLLAETLPSEAPDNSAPKYTGPEVKESDATKKLIERVGERDDTLPPDYRFGKQADPKDKGKPASSFTSPGAKPKTMAEEDVLDSLSADFVQSSAAPISKCSATVSHAAAPPSKQKQEPQKASTVASVSASQSGLNDKGAFDLLAESLPSEAPDTSAPKYTGPAVKESDSSKKKAERVGETEESIPPDYRFTEQADPKDKGKSNLLSSSTGAETKPETMTERDVLESLSADFVSAAPISKCSAAVSHSAAPPSLQQQAPLQASTVASVSASQSGAKDNDPFDLLAQTLPSEAPDNSAPKYTGPPVKESDVSKKKAERVGETEGSIPPDYRFTEKADPKDKGKLAYSSTDPGAKPKLLTKAELVDNLSSDFDSSSASQISKQKETKEKPAAKSDTKKARKH
ncbi:calpastatin isoform X11 [Pristis pectinata]|uniref:calpastatin isoform X11 n=1 Tax=Pristis pectinata TaxID=685728 RepID=UPI00223CE8F5|nr:calpastatin isoform X11 [Pristis pectinata]